MSGSALAARRSALAAALGGSSYDALLVTSRENIRYLSGFTGSNGGLLVTSGGECVLATDGRYLTQAAREAADLECLEARSVLVTLVERAAARGLRGLGFEAHALTVEQLGVLERAAGDDVDPRAAGHLVERQRVVKDAAELEVLRRAFEITDAAYGEVLGQLRPGTTEREVAWSLTDAMRRRGAEGPAFDIIAAFGENSAVPHHSPTDRPLARGELIKLDFGAKVDGYHADMTRTAVCGPAADWQREIHSEVAELQADLRNSATAGVVPSDLDAVMRAWLESHGRQVMHGLGHGVGLAIHEDPFLTPSSTADPLAPDAVVTIEPGIYLPGRGGVRIEDTVIVTADRPVVLTTSPRELVEV
ncbi:MAG TPA: Xaa-Pro peptidase family protein [Mycobacteriales bacterium]|nr:Xaa-Pro peptidase family protein [Mycobacteriales bacterium]